MTRIEERLRDAYLAAASTVLAGEIRALPGPPPGPPGRSRWRPLAPVGAAVALAVVIAAVFVLAPLVISGHQHRAARARPSAGAANGKIVFVRSAGRRHAQLWTVDPDGSGLAQLTRLPGISGDPSWARDGKELVFAHASRFASPPSAPSPLWNLYVINANGTGLRRLTHCGRPGCLQDYEPAWSPDRSQIAFVRNQDIYLMNANGSGVRRLTHAATPLGDAQPAWSPDGSKLAFVVLSADPGKHPAIDVMNADGTHVTRLTRCLTSCFDSEPAWSPDGTRIAFTRNQNVYTMTPAGGDVTRLTDCARVAGCALAGGPVWSPDGREIAFWVEGRDSIRQPYIMNADGSDVRPLIPKSSDVCCIAWQPLPHPGFRLISPAPRPSASVTVGRCVHVTTTRDFDGDGTPDVATLVDVLPIGQSCRQDLSHHLRIRVAFGSGGGFDRPFTYCHGGPCDTVFTATGLAGNGRSELAVDVGPGAPIDFAEFFRVGRHGLRPLRIAAVGAAKAGLRPGPAILGGSFDSGAQSPLACKIRPDGSRVLIFTQAQALSGHIPGPWRVQRVELMLRGTSLHVVKVSTATFSGFRIGSLRFANGCP